MTTRYVTKYALSAGITKQVGRLTPDGIYFVYGRHGFIRDRVDCFETMEAAVADAEVRRERKIASLKKQIAKLEKVTFA